ncbi:MAG: hypothetical protein ACLFQI_08755 [Halochromatium sp.]|uniref:hypothetical protein n=1 Tax=Halochromatium sp. TaxID=2049430 RepID=UPI00397D260D
MTTPLSPEAVVESIQRLNRAYLQTARDGLRAQPALAQALFGLEPPLAPWLASADSEAVERLARLPGTLFQPRLPAEPQRLLAACARSSDDQALPALHLLLHQLGGPEAEADQDQDHENGSALS